MALTQDDGLSDDLVQDTLERALRKRALWKRRGSVRSWLFRILYRVHIEFRRNSWSRLVRLPDPVGDTLSVEPARQERIVDCREIADAIAKLPREQRAAILLIALEGMSYDQAAGILDIPIGTLRSRLSRARQRLSRDWIGVGGRTRIRRVK